MARFSILLVAAVLLLSLAVDVADATCEGRSSKCKLDSFRAKKLKKRFRYVRGVRQCTLFSSAGTTCALHELHSRTHIEVS